MRAGRMASRGAPEPPEPRRVPPPVSDATAASQELGPGRHAGGAGNPRLAADGAGPAAGLRPLPEHLGAGRRVHRGAPHPERAAEPVRGRRALGLLHPGVRPAPRRGPPRGRRPGGERGVRAALAAGGGAGGASASSPRRGSSERWWAASPRPARRPSPRRCSSPASSSPARDSWCCRPGAWGCSTATGSSSSPTPRRWSGTWRRSPCWWSAGPRVDEDRLTTLARLGRGGGERAAGRGAAPGALAAAGALPAVARHHQRRDARRAQGLRAHPGGPRRGPGERAGGHLLRLAHLAPDGGGARATPSSWRCSRSRCSGCRSRRPSCPSWRARRRSGPRPPSGCGPRIDRGLERIAFFVVPSAVAFLLLGDVLGGAALPDRPVRRRRHPVALVPPDGLGGGAGRRDAGAPLRLRLLRAPGRAHAAGLRLDAGSCSRRPWPTCRCGTGRAGSGSRWRSAPWASPPPPGSPPGSSTSCSAGRWRGASAGPASPPAGWPGSGGARCAAGALGLLGKVWLTQRAGPAPSLMRFWGWEVLPAPALGPIAGGRAARPGVRRACTWV